MSLEDTLYPLIRLYESVPQSLKTLAGNAYRALPASWRQGKAYDRFQREARECESWSTADIKNYQVQAVRESLLAANKTPYYRKHFAERQVDPTLFKSLEQLRDYPLLTKQDLIEHREALVNPCINSRQRLYITTGGSSGEPVGFYLQRGVSRAKEQAHLETLWSRRGYEPGHKVAMMRGSVTSSRADGRISYYDATRDWLVLSSSHLTSARLPEYLQTLHDFQPEHLHLYPSSALLLARLMEQSGQTLGFTPVSILCGSERLTAEDQEVIERVFGGRVFHWYGHSERVVLAGQGSISDHLYFCPAYGYVEFGPTNAEGDSEVIGTSFHNHVMPLIRYRTGDYVRLAGNPHAERPGPEIEAVAGRGHEFLLGATGRRISLTTLNMHDRIFDGLCAVQFFQQQAGLVEMRYQPGLQWKTHQEPGIMEGLRRKLGDDFSICLRRVDTVERTPGGKGKWLATTALPS